jgi:hypothetical protein
VQNTPRSDFRSSAADGTGHAAAGSREPRPSKKATAPSPRTETITLPLSLSTPPPFNLPISHFGKAILFQPREGNRGEEGRGGGGSGSEHDERDHQRPHRAGRDPGRQLLLGALLPRARHPARWHHAQVTTLPISI